MNDLTRHAEQVSRNEDRLNRWAERWRRKFGVLPPSQAGSIDIDAKADAARMACCFAKDLITPRPTADILIHPALFEPPEVT